MIQGGRTGLNILPNPDARSGSKNTHACFREEGQSRVSEAAVSSHLKRECFLV